MKYNAKYDRWVSKDGLVYRYDSKQDRLVLCTEHIIPNKGYSKKGHTYLRNRAFSEFGKKYKEHFSIGSHENRKQYLIELNWYHNHNKVCRWEVEYKCKS